MNTSRRRFLQVSLAGAGLLALGGVGLSWQPTVLRTPSQPLRALSPRAYSVLAAVAERVCPGGDGLPSATEIDVASLIDGLLATMHPGVAGELERVLGLMENAVAGLVFDGNPRPFTASSPAVQDAVLDAWRTSRLSLRRQAFGAVKGLVASAYHAHPATFAGVGYPGPPPGLLASRSSGLPVTPGAFP